MFHGGIGLMRSAGAARLIGANIVVDAFGTAVFMAGVGFFAIGSVGASPAQVLNSLAVGNFVGVGLSFLAASAVDTFGPKRVLLFVQTFQFVAYFGMLVASSVGPVLALCALGAALSRVTSPVRGALPPIYLDKARLLEFKSTVKVWTVMAVIAGGGVAAVLGLVKSETGLLAIPGINCLSFVAAFALTVLLPRRGVVTERKRLSLYRPSSEILLSALLFAFLIALGSVPESAVAVLAAHERRVPDVVVAVAPAVGFVVALGGQRLLKGRSEVIRLHSRRLLIVGLVLEGFAICILDLVTFSSLGTVGTVALIVIASALAESALLAVTYTMWDLQYSLGEDSDRGGIIGIFSAATSIGFALSPALASVFFFKGLGASVISGVLVLVVAAASAATSLRRASADRVAARVD
jgi:hypothetical protein